MICSIILDNNYFSSKLLQVYKNFTVQRVGETRGFMLDDDFRERRQMLMNSI